MALAVPHRPPPSEDVEIRHLEYRHKRRLGELMAVNDAWKDFMSVIPMPDGLPDGKRFTGEDVGILDRAYRSGHAASGFELLVDEWGTMGRRRPTVSDVLRICLQMELYAAASYISSEILKGDPVRPPSAISDTQEIVKEFPAAAFNGRGGGGVDDTDDEEPIPGCSAPPTADLDFDALLEADLELTAAGENGDDSDFLTCPIAFENTLLAHSVPYSYLCAITENFSPARFVDRGGFATVYRGVTLRSKAQLAVKKLNSQSRANNREAMFQQLNYEVDQLPRLKHPNIIDLLGYSNDNHEHPCLLFPFMVGGTLEKRLAVVDLPAPLASRKRLEVALGVAQGIHYLHSRQKLLIHRDIKTSNILLDATDSPKIADFGLLRYAVSGEGESMTFTQSAKGTPAYMPPEAITCDMSSKWDVWSYGVVLLELLTGLPVMDRSREDHDLTSHVKNMAEEPDFAIEQVLDPKCDWRPEDARRIFDVADSCLKRNKKHRPAMLDVIGMIEALLG